MVKRHCWIDVGHLLCGSDVACASCWTLPPSVSARKVWYKSSFIVICRSRLWSFADVIFTGIAPSHCLFTVLFTDILTALSSFTVLSLTFPPTFALSFLTAFHSHSHRRFHCPFSLIISSAFQWHFHWHSSPLSFWDRSLEVWYWKAVVA